MSGFMSVFLHASTVIGGLILAFLAFAFVLLGGVWLWEKFLEAVWNAFYEREYRREKAARQPQTPGDGDE